MTLCLDVFFITTHYPPSKSEKSIQIPNSIHMYPN